MYKLLCSCFWDNWCPVGLARYLQRSGLRGVKRIHKKDHIMDKKDLIKKASEVFESNPTLTEVFFTTDGMPFTTNHSGINHEKSIRSLRKLPDGFALEVVKREECEKPVVPKKTALELIEEIEAALSVEDVVAILGDDKRATVVKAAESKIAALNAEAAASEGGKENE